MECCWSLSIDGWSIFFEKFNSIKLVKTVDSNFKNIKISITTQTKIGQNRMTILTLTTKNFILKKFQIQIDSKNHWVNGINFEYLSGIYFCNGSGILIPSAV